MHLPTYLPTYYLLTTCSLLRQHPFSHDAPEDKMDEDEMYLDSAEVIEDDALPGWTVTSRTTTSGRVYKSFTTPQVSTCCILHALVLYHAAG